MVIGRGDIGKAIEDREGFLFYANGISNRYTITGLAKDKEEEEILTHARTLKMFVYISTLSIYYSDSAYTQHKLRMEKLIKTNFRHYCILRIGNITWGSNPNTLVNHLKKDKSNIQDTFRYLINKGEFQHWCNMIPREDQHIMNVTGKQLKVKDIVKLIEHEAI
jgi:hypothetical protein